MKIYSIDLSDEEWNHVIWHMYQSGQPCDTRNKILKSLAEKGMKVIDQ